MSNFEWLLTEPWADVALPPVTLFEADDDNWRVRVERVPLAPSLHVFLNDLETRRDVRAQPMRPIDGDYLVGQVALEGRLDLDFRDGLVAAATPQTAILYRPSDSVFHAFEAGVRFRSVGYCMALPRVERLFEGEMPAGLSRMLDGERPDRYMLAGNRGLMRNLARALLTSRLNGPLRRLMIEGAILQMFALQAAAASRPIRLARPLSAREQSAVGEARDRLLADMRHPPTLGELAEATGLGERRLNAAFRASFGASAFEILRSYRLEQARLALEAGAASLKEVAYRVGYNEVSNFIHAFRDRYGAPPRKFIAKKI